MADPGLVTAVVADDEALARRRILQLLAGHDDVRVVAQCATGPATVEAVRALSPHVLFLDVQMPGFDGFEVLSRLPSDDRPIVVFSTAYDEYALAAFDVSAVDYLLKPFDDERFEASLGRAKRALRGERARELRDRLHALLEQVRTPGAPRAGALRSGLLERFAVRHRNRLMLIEASSVDWVEAEGDYLSLHVGPETHLVRGTMASLEERLDPTRFVRIHRSTIVRLDRIRHLEIADRGVYVAVLHGGERLRVGPRYRDALLDRVGVR